MPPSRVRERTEFGTRARFRRIWVPRRLVVRTNLSIPRSTRDVAQMLTIPLNRYIRDPRQHPLQATRHEMASGRERRHWSRPHPLLKGDGLCEILQGPGQAPRSPIYWRRLQQRGQAAIPPPRHAQTQAEYDGLNNPRAQDRARDQRFGHPEPGGPPGLRPQPAPA